MARIRKTLADNRAEWDRALSHAPFKKKFRLAGESLVRPPRGYRADHPLIEDLKRKDFIAVADLDEKLACSPGFIDKFTEICLASSRFMKFLCRANELKW